MYQDTLGSLPVLALVVLAAPAAAQLTPVVGVPMEASATDEVDFGDVDLDGDWDAAFADGAEVGTDQNRLWTNQGGLQGGVLGAFVDTTATSFPTVNDSSRDVEFVDFDGDLDLDLYIANTSSVLNQSSRFWTNRGGLQGETVGTYVDESAARWVGLGEPGSSIPPAYLFPSVAEPEGFIDWACDADFADLDSDGDMDLVHSSYGGNFSGLVPTRLFLNDGAGHFEEHNPSGFQLAGGNLPDGAPGLWAEGTQEHGTTAVDGSKCDIATSGLDVELADIDGDLDVDLLLGSRNDEPRLFVNRLEETGMLVFRDVSHALLPTDWAPAQGNYEQEFGDLDLDGDLDLYGLNWGQPFSDKVFLNDGSGSFGHEMTLPDSGADDNEGDFLDYDSDGDLDLYVANWSGANKLYANRFVETGSVSFELVEEGASLAITLDSDAVDLDGDGDPDVIDAMALFEPNLLLENQYDVPDVHAPYFGAAETLEDRSAGPDPVPVRVAVLDNAAYYVNAFLDVAVALTVDGVELPPGRMKNAAPQLFRTELPGNLVGTVVVEVRAADAYGNASSELLGDYEATGSPGVESGTGTQSSTGATPRLWTVTEPIAGSPAVVVAEGVAPGSAGLLLLGSGALPAVDLGDGALLQVFPLLGSPVPLQADAAGLSVLLSKTQPGLAGATLHVQYLALDGAAGNTWASSNRLVLGF